MEMDRKFADEKRKIYEKNGKLDLALFMKKKKEKLKIMSLDFAEKNMKI
jgi:hypothetical protein